LEVLDWLHPHHRMTHRLVGSVIASAGQEPNTTVARRYGLDEGTVRKIMSRHYDEMQAIYVPRSPIHLGIDEIRIGGIGGEVYGVFTDTTERRILELSRGVSRDIMAAAIERFVDRERTEVITMDMTLHYAALAREYFPNALIVLDKFHVVRRANRVIDAYRVTLERKLGRGPARRALFVNKQLLRTRRRKLTGAQVHQLDIVWGSIYPELVQVYNLKEAFFEIYDAKTYPAAKARLNAWRESIPEALRPRFQTILTSLETWEDGILNFALYPVTNAFTESVNRGIRKADRDGRGHTFESLRSRMIFGQQHRKIREREKKPAAESTLPAPTGEKSAAVVSTLPTRTKGSLIEFPERKWIRTADRMVRQESLLEAIMRVNSEEAKKEEPAAAVSPPAPTREPLIPAMFRRIKEEEAREEKSETDN